MIDITSVSVTPNPITIKNILVISVGVTSNDNFITADGYVLLTSDNKEFVPA